MKNKEMSNFFIKLLVILPILIIFAVSMCSYVGKRINGIKKELHNSGNLLAEKYNKTSMVSSGENNLSVTPLDAKIDNYNVTISVQLHNQTGNNLELKDFAVANFAGYDVPCTIESENYQIANNTDQNITIKFNVKAFQKINVIPTEIDVKLETYINGNFNPYNIENYIAWE